MEKELEELVGWNFGLAEEPKYSDNCINRQKNQLSKEDNSPVSIQAIIEYVALMWIQYQGTSKKFKSRLLDELVRNLKIHRKAAIRLMTSRVPPKQNQGKIKRTVKFRYSDLAKKHLVLLWRKTGYMGSIRLKAALPEWIKFHDEPECTESVKAEILQMSARSIDRFLAGERSALKRRINASTRRGSMKILTQIPIRDLGSKVEEIGHCEIDTVAHCGSSLTGTFVYTLTLTDIYTGWVECEAMWGKDSYTVLNALRRIEERLPFKIRCLYSDNGTEFMNKILVKKFILDEQGKARMGFKRSRPYKKNDNCYVEQKNYTHVRRFFGYGRIDWERSVDYMNHIYRRDWRLVTNYFFPQFKLISKTRVQSKIKRKNDCPRTPYERLLPYLTEESSRICKNEKESINPITTVERIKKSIIHLYRYLENGFSKEERGIITL